MAGLWEAIGGVRMNPLTIRGEAVPPNVGPLGIRKFLPDGTVVTPPPPPPPPTGGGGGGGLTVFGSSAPNYSGDVAGVRTAFGSLPCRRAYNNSLMSPPGAADHCPSYYAEISNGFTQAQLDAFVALVRDNTDPGKTSFITHGHENDQAAKGTPVLQYNAELVMMCNTAVRLGQGKVRVAPVGRGFLIRTATGPSNWTSAHWTTATSTAMRQIDPTSGRQVGVLSFDLYNGKTASQDFTPAGLYGSLVAMAANLGIGWGTAESSYATYHGAPAPNGTTAVRGIRTDTTGGYDNAGLAGYWTAVNTYLKANPPEVFIYWQSDNQAAGGPTVDANGYVLQRTPFLNGQFTDAYPQACIAVANMFARSA